MKKTVVKIENLSKAYSLWKRPGQGIWVMLVQQIYRILPLERIGFRSFKDWKRSFVSEFQALHPFSLEIEEGECLGIIGRNGSGKSTILQLIAGVLEPSTGSTVCQGKVAALLELGSGFNKEFTGRENVFLNAAIHGISRRETEQLFESIKEFAEIGEFIDRKVKTYSSGMVVRLAFSVLVHLRPDILIIDEALAVGDAFFVQKCMRWLEKFKKNKTVILVSHDLSAITRFCDRVAWIDKGVVKYVGSPRRAAELYLESTYADIPVVSKKSDEEEKDEAISSDVPETEMRDIRQPEIVLHNDNNLPFVTLYKDSPSFGDRKIEIVYINLFERDGDQYSRLVRGGEKVQLKVVIEAREEVSSPIVGFGLKNKHGQELFHDNTYLTSYLADKEPIHLLPGERAVAAFEFVMPYLPSGDYFLFVAVATGTHRSHQQQHWIHEAIKLTSASRRICLGLIGLPMLDVTLRKINKE